MDLNHRPHPYQRCALTNWAICPYFFVYDNKYIESEHKINLILCNMTYLTKNEGIQCIIDFTKRHPKWVIAIRWQTATWKTALSIELSQYFETEIISADSRQIFRYMDIWTDKISQEIRNKIPHYQIDIVDPDEIYSSAQWQSDTLWHIQTIFDKWKKPLVVWWTGLYIDMIYRNFDMPDCIANYDRRAELEEMEKNNPWILREILNKIDPQAAQQNHPNSLRFIIRAIELFEQTWYNKTYRSWKRKSSFPLLMVGLWRWVESWDQLIKNRLVEMEKNGFIQEVEWLINHWYADVLDSKKPILYPITKQYLAGEFDREEWMERMFRGDRVLAKKQRTWFRKYLAESETKPYDNVEYCNIWVEN